MAPNIKDKIKSKNQLIDELVELRQRVAELEESRNPGKKTEESLGDSSEIDLEKLLEMKQLALEERYRALFENIPIETIIVDTEAKVTGTNLTKKTNGKQGPHVGQVMYKDYAGKHEINMYQELMDCIKSGIPKEFPKQKYDGNFLRIWMAPFTGGAIITSIDVTDHVLVEEAMHKSQKRARFLAQILDNVSQPLTVAYADGRLMTYNTAYCNMTGYTKEELREVKWFTDLVPPKWHELVTNATEKMLSTKEPQRFEMECLHKDRTQVPVEVVAYPLIDSKGTLRSYYSFYTHLEKTNRTEAVHNENKDGFRMVYEDVPIMICGFDRSGHCVFWNHECERWLGWKKNEAMADDQNILTRIYPDPNVLEKVKKTFSKPDKVFREFTVYTKNGSKRTQLWANYSLKDKTNIAIGYDITKWKLEEKRLHQYISELQEVNTELSHYNIVISHDLRAPLYAIQNYTTFFREDLEANLSDDHKVYLNGLEKAVQEARDMVDGLLELARIGQEKDILAEDVRMGSFLRELITSLDLPSDVHITMADDWPNLKIEPDLLRQIFWNLIDNAVKFNNSVHKLVEMGWQSLDNDQYEFYVRDNGIGIEPRYWDQIFGIFERLHTRDEFPGTGIGLAIVKKAVHELDGSIGLESKPGEGSTFLITLPKDQKQNKEKQSV